MRPARFGRFAFERAVTLIGGLAGRRGRALECAVARPDFEAE
jgi:hypothetical protein